ncbi:Glycosyltransferase, GT2 family [Pustulibacterium marinum]|uniref:Glycosyltransferase, GT2 family n=1 Tax=Pustulibacterium marinum TaxID=1224947 RepID=A0A1I7F9T6_9FLAO|nr:glycosyltransferase family 2 protein [Pustulibacterium marinum]SFU32921.1 Glycosyltransferase, GT2 family [Pustulibacterium marinum]
MKLSVVILNYNVRYFLELCLQSVTKATSHLDAEIIVVDNASEDESVSMVQQKYPNVKLIANKENTGFPKGNNMGVAIAEGEYVCILNPDTVVAEDTFDKFLDFVKDKEKLGIVGPKLIDGSGRFLPESKRGIPTPWVAFTKFLELYRYAPKWFGKYYYMQLDKDQVGEVEILVGAFMFMKRNLYVELGGFDEGCFMYSDDLDISYESMKTGYTNYYFPKTNVIHYKGESTNKDETFLRRFREAMNFFYRKHFRVNILFDLMMRLGASTFSLMKLLKMKQHSSVHFNPEKYLLVSDDISLAEKIKESTKKEVELVTVSEIQKMISKNKQIEVIFDVNFLCYKQIIQYFTMLSGRGFTYKMIPKGTNYMVGSNFSDAKGEVIFF